MITRYLTKVALTSLALTLPVTAATPRPSPPPLDCADLHRLYSARMFRRARAQMLLDLALQRAGRPSHETRDPKLKHLLALLATKC